jgi:hypothetical protein
MENPYEGSASSRGPNGGAPSSAPQVSADAQRRLVIRAAPAASTVRYHSNPHRS